PLEHRERVFGVVFSPNGKRIVTASADKTAQVWDAVAGEPFGPPLAHGGAVYSVALSPNGRVAATACQDGSARLWDIQTGKPIGMRLVHPFPVHRVVFSPDGGKLLSGSEHVARLWDVPSPMNGDVEQIFSRMEASAGAELLENGAFRDLEPEEWRER